MLKTHSSLLAFMYICFDEGNFKQRQLTEIIKSRKPCTWVVGMLCATRKRDANTIAKFDKIKEILSECDNLEQDLQIPSLCPTLERLGSI